MARVTSEYPKVTYTRDGEDKAVATLSYDIASVDLSRAGTKHTYVPLDTQDRRNIRNILIAAAPLDATKGQTYSPDGGTVEPTSELAEARAEKYRAALISALTNPDDVEISVQETGGKYAVGVACKKAPVFNEPSQSRATARSM